MTTEIYLDNNATTHLSEAVRRALSAAICDDFGNASSEHRSGERTRRAITRSRDQVACLLGALPDQVVFGSGVTELNFWVLSRLLQKTRAHLVTSQVEHSCVLRAADYLESQGVQVTRLPVDPFGRIEIEQLLNSISSATTLVSIQWVNNETGVVQPIAEIAEICRHAGVAFHCDAAQAMGKTPIDFASSGIDYLTVSAHKMHGPAGIGALCIKESKSFERLLHGGDQERGLRPGTENVLGIIGFGEAARERYQSLDPTIEAISKLRDSFESTIVSALPQVRINGSLKHRVCNSSNLQFPKLDGAAVVAMLDREGMRCSQSSACTSNLPEPSHVLRAMGLSEAEAFSSVRFSFSNQNTAAEVQTAASTVVSVVNRLADFEGSPEYQPRPRGVVNHEV
jgi:cysteine desulfurase